MCSSFKASLAACVLASVDRGQARLGELIAYGPADLMEWAPVAKRTWKKALMSWPTCARLRLPRVLATTRALTSAGTTAASHMSAHRHSAFFKFCWQRVPIPLSQRGLSDQLAQASLTAVDAGEDAVPQVMP